MPGPGLITDYLTPLRLKYPMDRTLKEQQKRMAALGISSFDELWTRRRQR